MRFLFSSFIVFTALFISSAYAACSTPAGEEGEIIYNESYKIAQLCNGTDWLAWGSGTDGSGWDRNGTSTYYNVGNVGIGTDSPTRNLEIYSSTVGSLKIGSLGTGVASQSVFELGTDAANSKVWQLYARGTGYNTADQQNDLGFAFYDGSTYKTAMTIDSLTGNVGIGTNKPIAKLQVEGGTIRAGRVNATLEGGDIKFSYPENDGTSGDSSWVYDVYGTPSSPDFRIYNVSSAGTVKHVMFLENSGNVGIGTTVPSYKLHVEGTAYATGAAGSLSDRRHKKEIIGLPDTGLATVTALRPVSFLWKEPQDKPMEGKQLGFIAQEVEDVLPEAVLTQDNDEHTKGLKYNVFMPVMVKAIQELKAENDTFRKELDEIKAKLQ